MLGGGDAATTSNKEEAARKPPFKQSNLPFWSTDPKYEPRFSHKSINVPLHGDAPRPDNGLREHQSSKSSQLHTKKIELDKISRIVINFVETSLY